MTEQKKTTIKDFVSIAMLSAALVFGLTHMPTSAGDQELAQANVCAVQLAEAAH